MGKKQKRAKIGVVSILTLIFVALKLSGLVD